MWGESSSNLLANRDIYFPATAAHPFGTAAQPVLLQRDMLAEPGVLKHIDGVARSHIAVSRRDVIFGIAGVGTALHFFVQIAVVARAKDRRRAIDKRL